MGRGNPSVDGWMDGCGLYTQKGAVFIPRLELGDSDAGYSMVNLRDMVLTKEASHKRTKAA